MRVYRILTLMMILPEESPGEVSDHQSRFARAGAAGHSDPDTELVPGPGVSSDHLDHLMTVIMMITAHMRHHHMVMSHITLVWRQTSRSRKKVLDMK